MKKTLAAVLAAAMALSTASVVFATDYSIEGMDYTVNGDINGEETPILYGKDVTVLLDNVTFEVGGDDYNVSGEELAAKIDDGQITLTPVVTVGANKLAGKPSVNTGVNKVGNGTFKSEVVYKATATVAGWSTEDGKFSFPAENEEVVKLPIGKNGKLAMDPTGAQIAGYVTPKSSRWNRVADEAFGYGYLTKETIYGSTELADEAVRVKFKVSDTYGVDDTTIGMKFRVTVKKKDVTLGGKAVSKGDTLSSDEIKFKARYLELNQYNEDMQLTLDEVSGRHVKLDGSKLYDEIGSETFTINFEDVAVFEAKLSASQKKVNLFYDLDEITAITDEYPDVDFTFITFRGNPNPSFVNSGTMTFDAIGGRKTVVYTWDGEALTPLDQYTTYDPTYNTVKVKNVKKLGTFVVASDMLEEEVDEPAEPVSSAPVVEEPEEDENPKTGAC